MEIILTNKNSDFWRVCCYWFLKGMLIYNIEHCQKTLSLSWRCAQSNCNWRVHTKKDSVKIVKDHCHFPDPADIERGKFRKTLDDRAAVSDVTQRQTIFAAQRVWTQKQLKRHFQNWSRSSRTIVLEKVCTGQKVARPKKVNYQKLDKKLITMIRSYHPNDIICFWKEPSSWTLCSTLDIHVIIFTQFIVFFSENWKKNFASRDLIFWSLEWESNTFYTFYIISKPFGLCFWTDLLYDLWLFDLQLRSRLIFRSVNQFFWR